jgi:fumarate reductase flavoprotein subunit
MNEKKVDLCIVGGSAAGMSAAIVAKRKGIKDILILEKMSNTGGTALMTAGIMAYNSPTQRRQGLYYDVDQVFRDYITIMNWNCDAKLLRKWLLGTGESIEFLESIGMHYDLAVTETADPSKFRNSRHIPAKLVNGKWEIVKQGPLLMSIMLKACKDIGIEILCDTRAEHLIKAEDDRVVGVKASTKDGELAVNADAVILASGSISYNKELVRELCGVDQYGNDDFLIAASFPWNTGDGYYMAREVGAKKGRVCAYFMGPHNHVSGYSEIHTCLIRRGHTIDVNRNGERFCDESLMTESEYGWMKGTSLDNQPGRVCYTIFDENYMCLLEADGEYRFSGLVVPYIDEPMDWPGAYKEEGFETKNWRKSIRHHIDHDAAGGRAKVCNTIGEIADYIGCEEETLKRTIDNYNVSCAKKYDAEFLKKSKFLYPVQTPPFYVLRGDGCIDTAIGGVTIDNYQRVVDEEGKYIPGLYAAGVMCSGWANGQYVVNCAAMSFTIYSGRTAGEEAADYIVKG